MVRRPRAREDEFDASDLRRIASAVDLVLRATRPSQLLIAIETLVPLDAITVWASSSRVGRPWHLAADPGALDELRHALAASGRDGRRSYRLVGWRRRSRTAFSGRERTLFEAVAPIVARAVRLHGARGGRVLTSALGVRLAQLGSRPRGAAGAVRPRLTPRELRIGALVARGHSNSEIAYELGVSQHTVKQHLKGAFKKLGVRGRTELALLLVRDGHVGS